MKRALSLLFAILMICSSLLTGCGKSSDADTAADTQTSADSAVPEESPKLEGCTIEHEPEFGGAYIRCTIDDFNALGFEYGDSVTVTFSNGYVMEDLPYYNGYYTSVGEPLLIAYHGYPYIKAAINNGDDLFEVAGLKDDDTATITLFGRGKYLPVQDARNISYVDIREKYDSDEEFANFRSVRAGEIEENVLFRSASPCDNQHNRATYVDDLIEAAGVEFILDLADYDDTIAHYLEDEDFSCDYFLTLYNTMKVLPIGLNMNFPSQAFREKLAGGLAIMAENDGPYLVHCTEGKDRTGFVCMLLEALCGASYDEIVEDYMITYDNYYGISKTSQSDRYDVIVESVLSPMIQCVAGDGADITTCDLSVGAREYLISGGMTDEQIDLLISRLTGK